MTTSYRSCSLNFIIGQTSVSPNHWPINRPLRLRRATTTLRSFSLDFPGQPGAECLCELWHDGAGETGICCRVLHELHIVAGVGHDDDLMIVRGPAFQRGIE